MIERLRGKNIFPCTTKMHSFFVTFLLLLLLSGGGDSVCSGIELQAVERARKGILKAVNWAQSFDTLGAPEGDSVSFDVALGDCVKLYREAEPRLARLVSGDGDGFSKHDAVTWLSAALASHVICLDELRLGVSVRESGWPLDARNLTGVIREALAVVNGIPRDRRKAARITRRSSGGGLLGSWNAATSKADFVVAQDGSGQYKTINEAVTAISRLGQQRPERAVVYVKSGVYREKVEISGDLRNIMFVGDGIDRTVVTGNGNVQDGDTTLSSATFGVSGDGFWARDMTFENTAGPEKQQAVAMRVSSDLSVLYRCSFKGYQDTLLALSARQFYRDCQIHGTIDFIFGDAAAVFQNCDIFVRRPIGHQSNMITAQGRNDPNENTGISIQNCRVRPDEDFTAVKGEFKSYLGRPWQRYSRTVFMETDLDGLIDERGWSEWSGDFALSTLYFAEYMNTGTRASTSNRVSWPGYHVLRDPGEAESFTVKNFIVGESWIPATGVPFKAGL